METTLTNQTKMCTVAIQKFSRNVAYKNLMKDEFIAWHRACITLWSRDQATREKWRKEFDEKMTFFKFVNEMIVSAEDGAAVESLEDLLSERLSTEAVHKLVSIL